MPLDPRIALGVQVPQVAIPDFLQTQLQAQQIAAQQQLAQQRTVTLAEMLRQRQNELNTQGYFGSLSQPQQQAMPQENAGPITQTEFTAANVTPTQPVPVTLPESAPRTMATAGGQSVAVPGGSPRVPVFSELAAVGGQAGMDAYARYQKAMQGDAAAQKDLVEAGLDRIRYASMMLAIPQNERQYQEVRGDLGQRYPEFQSILPETFDPAAIAKIQDGLQRAASKAKTVQFGLQPHYFRDPKTGETVPMQFGSGGEAVRSKGLEGLEPLMPVMQVDTATGTQLRSRMGGLPIDEVPKQLTEAERRKQVGAVGGEYEAKLPQRALEARGTLTRLEEKHRQAEQKIDQALQYLKTASLPTTGRLGAVASALGYEPGMDLRAMIQSLRSQVGLDELIDLKSRGGTLGAVSDAEGARLDTAIANLNPDQQSTPSLVEALETLRAGLGRTRQRLSQQYQAEFVEGQGRQGASDAVSREQGTSANRKRVTRAQAQEILQKENALRQQAGAPALTLADIHERLKRNHYELVD